MLDPPSKSWTGQQTRWRSPPRQRSHVLPSHHSTGYVNTTGHFLRCAIPKQRRDGHKPGYFLCSFEEAEEPRRCEKMTLSRVYLKWLLPSAGPLVRTISRRNRGTVRQGTGDTLPLKQTEVAAAAGMEARVLIEAFQSMPTRVLGSAHPRQDGI